MKHIPIRLGPLALLLAVISICMTTLGILTFTTARADLSMAEKYAETVQARYGLEKEGQRFLLEAGEVLEGGAGLQSLPDTDTDEDGVTWKRIVDGDYSLLVGIRPEEGEGAGLQVVGWRLTKAWEEDTSMGNLWNGE